MAEETTKRTFKILFLDEAMLTGYFPKFFPNFLREKYPGIVEACDFEFVVATNVQQGSALVRSGHFDAVIMEVVLANNPEAGKELIELQERRRSLVREIYDEQGELKPVSEEVKTRVRFLLGKNFDQIGTYLSFSGGFEVLAQLRDAKLPVVFVTTQSSADIARGMMQFPLISWRYFVKPTDVKLVAEALLELLSLKN